MPNSLTMKKVLLTMVAIATHIVVLAQSTVSTTTNTANNGGGGATMFEVSSTAAVFITGASSVFGAASGTTGPVEVWYKQGSITSNYPGSGNVSVAGGWTLALTGSATSAGTTSYASIGFGSTMIPLSGGTVYTFVINGAGTLGGTSYMTGTTGSPNLFTDGILTIDNLNARGGTIPSSMGNSPRYFVGSITYIPQLACTGTPTPGTSISSHTNVCPNQNFTLSLQGATVAGSMAYQWQSATTASGPWNNITGLTTGLATTSQTSDLWYRCEVICSATSLSAYSTPVQVLTYPNLASGTYTIGSGGNYSNFTAAFAAASCGVSGPVIFSVLPNSGPYNEQLILPNIPGMSSTNTITVNGNGNTLWYKSNNTNQRAVIKLDGTDYLTFKNLNIRAVGNSTTIFGFGVQLMNGANYNTFKNCTIQVTDSSTSTNYAAFVCSNTHTSATAGGLAASYLTVDSCSILGGYYGLTLGGVSGTKFNLPTGNKIRHTNIHNFYYYGAYMLGQNGLLFKRNDITRVTRSGPISSMYGILISGRQVGGSRIEGNKIHDNAGSATATSQTFYGIYASSAVGEKFNPFVIANNVFYNINHNIGSMYGLYTFSLDSTRVLHNNLNFDNPSATGTTVTYGSYFSGAPLDLEVKNNVFTINHANTGVKYAQYWATSTAVPNSNNNSFDFTGAGGTANNVGFLGSAKTTLAAWQASAGTPDLASVMTNPLFVSASTGDLTPQASGLNASGANVLTWVPLDINNVSRTTTPDMGAYEYTPAGCSPPTLSVTSVIGTSAVIAVTSTNVGGSYTYEWGPCGFQQGTGSTFTLPSSGNINLTGLAPSTCYRIYVKSNCSGGQTSLSVFADFTTPCVSGIMPYLETFTAYPAPCWTTSGSNTWMQYLSGSNGMARANFWSWPSGSTAIYTTHPINISSTATVGFKWAHQAMANYPLDGFVLRVRKTSSSVWDTLFSKAGANLSSPGGGITTPGTFITELKYLAASYVGSEAIFELRANSGFGPDLFIDDFEVKAVPACPDPVLVSTGKTSTSVSLSWANVPGTVPLKSKIIWGPQGFLNSTGATGTVVNQINSPYTVSGLSPNTYYDFYVQDSCGGGNFSALIGPLTIKTLCVSALAGTYTINAALPAIGTNFNKLDSAVTLLSQCGITAATTLNIAAAIFTGSINLGAVQGASALRPITFNGAGMNLTKINAGLGSAASVDLNGAKHIRFQNMTLNNSGGLYGVRLLNNADSIVIQHCKVIADSVGTSLGAAIAATGGTNSPILAGGDVDNIFIKNNVIIGGYYGLALMGTSLTNFDENFVVENNIFRQQYAYGTRLYYIKNVNITGNTFKNFRNTSSYGLYAFYTANMNVVSNNIIAGTYGMYLYYPNYNAVAAPGGGNNYIVNNMLKGNSYGAYVYSPRYYHIYHNTFSGGYGYYQSSSTVVASGLQSVNVKNNIFAGTTYATFITPLPTTANNFTLDYNAYQGSATTLAYCGTAQASLAAWQTAQPTFNAYSVSGSVLFMANDDLHILGSFPNDLGALLGVATDIDGQVRPAAGSTAPDMGADEFTPIANDSRVVAILGAGGGCGSAATSLSLVFDNYGINNITSMPVSVKVTSPTGIVSTITSTYSGNLVPYSRDTVLVGAVNTYNGGLFSFKGYSSLLNDGRANNDTVLKLNVNYIPFEPQVGPTDTVCVNQDSIQLNVPGYPGTMMGWYTASTGGSNFSTGNSATVPTNGQSTYYVQYESSSDTVQIGTGAAVSTSTLITPYKTFYMDGRVQYLILASEMAALGAFPGNINSVAFDVVTAAAQTMGNFTISMGSTTSSVMTASYLPNAGFSTVYTNTAYAATPGWNVHTFSTPYLWNGSDNVVIEVCFDNASWTSNTSVRYSPTTFNSVTDGFADLSTTSGCTPGAITTSSASGDRPNMRFAVTSAACSSIRNPVSFVASADTALAVGAGVEAPAGTFSFNSTGSNGDSYTWYYGDGFNGTGAATSHTYAGAGSFVVSLVVTDSSCGTIDSIAFTVTSHIGMEENFGQSLWAYPNPSNGQFVVEIVGSEALDGHLELINGLGQVVVSKSISKASGAVKFPIDVREMPKGVYTLRLSALEGQRVLRVVLQ